MYDREIEPTHIETIVVGLLLFGVVVKQCRDRKPLPISAEIILQIRGMACLVKKSHTALSVCITASQAFSFTAVRSSLDVVG